MVRRYAFIGGHAIALLGGYVALFLLLHAPIPGAEPGLLAVLAPGYLRAAAEWNPILRLNARFGGDQAAVVRLGLLLALGWLFAVYAHAVHGLRQGRALPGGLRALLAGAAAFGAPLIALPYILSSDVYSYMFQGRIAAIYGANPALTIPLRYAQDPFFKYVLYWTYTPSVYGPVWTLLSHALTLLVARAGDGLWLYLLAYKLVALLAHLASAALVWSILGRWKPEQRAWGTLLYAWNPLALIEFAGSAHNDALMLALLLLALWFAQRGGWRRATLAFVAAAMVKWIVVVLLPLYGILLLRQRPTWRARLVCAGQMLALAAAFALALYSVYGDPARTLAAVAATPATANAANSLGEFAIKSGPDALHWLGLAPERYPNADEVLERRSAVDTQRAAIAVGVGWASKAITALAWLLALWAVWRRPTFERFVQGGYWLMLAMLLVAPFFQPWYVTWLLALAALLAWRPAGQVTLAFSASAQFVYLVWRGRALLAFLPILALLAFLLWRERRSQAGKLAPAVPSGRPLPSGAARGPAEAP